MSTIDIIAVKDEIKRYKARLVELDRENKSLNTELSTLTDRKTARRVEQNILACMEEIRFHDESTEISSGADNFDKKFREANMKLEISILNEEIRAVLPRLEMDVAAQEQRVKQCQRALKEQQAEMSLIPKTYLIDPKDMMEKIGQLKKQRDTIQCKHSFQNDILLRFKQIFDFLSDYINDFLQ